MNRQSLVLAVAAGALIALPAAAQVHVAQAEPTMPALTQSTPAAASLPDAAKVVTKSDAQKFAEAEFAYADADKNLKLSRAEFVAIDKARKDKMAGAKATSPSPAAGTPDTTAALTPSTPDTGKTPDAQFSDLAGKETALSKQVFIDSRLKAFDTADADKNGSLSVAENAKFGEIVLGKSVM